MNEDIKRRVGASSAECKDAAGLRSSEAIRDCNAGFELRLESKVEGLIEDPLFMRDSPEGHKGTAQDEKDEAAE